MYDALSIDPSRKKLRAMDAEGSHGTNGTPQSLGFLACGTKSRSPIVLTNKIGTVIVYPIQPSLWAQ